MMSAMPQTGRDPAPPAVFLAVADGVALVAFVVIGMRSHHEDALWWVFVRNAVPLLISWFALAALLGTYRRPGFPSLVRTWVVAVPIALVARSIWVGSPTGARFFTFVAVGMAFTLLFLLMGRGAAIVVTGRGYPWRRSGQ